MRSNNKQGLCLVPWIVCTMPMDEGGLGLTDVTTHGSILVASGWSIVLRTGVIN